MQQLMARIIRCLIFTSFNSDKDNLGDALVYLIHYINYLSCCLHQCCVMQMNNVSKCSQTLGQTNDMFTPSSDIEMVSHPSFQSIHNFMRIGQCNYFHIEFIVIFSTKCWPILSLHSKLVALQIIACHLYHAQFGICSLIIFSDVCSKRKTRRFMRLLCLCLCLYAIHITIVNLLFYRFW